MILLRELLEAKPKTTDFSAISKESGKLVYFSTKDNMDAAVKDGTHDKPKVKGKDVKTPKSSDLFKGDYEKERGDTIDDTGNSAKEIINGIKNIGYSSMVTLYRKNKNGKLVQDVRFSTREDITPEIIKTTADTYGIDLNLISKLGVDTKIKNRDGRNQSISELMAGLILSDLEAKQYAPDGVAADDYYYKTYSDSANKEANAIKKGIDPNEAEKQLVKKADKAESDKTALYNSETTKDITKEFVRIKEGNSLWNSKIDSKVVAKMANKFKIDVNRILQHPETFFDVSGFKPNEADLKDWGYKNLKDYAIVQLRHTIYFGTFNEIDAMDDLSSLQLAYPLKYKTLSDNEWSKTMKNELENPTTVEGGLRSFINKEKDGDTDNSFVGISKANDKNQSKWVKKQAKKKNTYISDMYSYQSMINKGALNRIDEMLKLDPPPPVQTNALYRGMAMTQKDYSKFIKSFKEGNNIDLPISSFSFDANTATEFANNVGNANATINKANNQSIMIKVVNSRNTFNGFCMNANIDNVSAQKLPGVGVDDFKNWRGQHEVLLPSNNKYKVVKTESKKMEGGRSLTIITLEQIVTKNEIKLREFIDDNEKDILKKHLQYPNRTSLLYTKEGEN
jgi:hypothetical protein